MRFQTKNGVLIAQANGETLRIEPWGKDSLRVRATMLPGFSGKDWALTEVPEKTEAKAEQFEVDHLEIDGSMGKRTSAPITNGKIRAVVNFAGVILLTKIKKETNLEMQIKNILRYKMLINWSYIIGYLLVTPFICIFLYTYRHLWWLMITMFGLILAGVLTDYFLFHHVSDRIKELTHVNKELMELKKKHKE